MREREAEGATGDLMTSRERAGEEGEEGKVGGCRSVTASARVASAVAPSAFVIATVMLHRIFCEVEKEEEMSNDEKRHDPMPFEEGAEQGLDTAARGEVRVRRTDTPVEERKERERASVSA